MAPRLPPALPGTSLACASPGPLVCLTLISWILGHASLYSSTERSSSTHLISPLSAAHVGDAGQGSRRRGSIFAARRQQGIQESEPARRDPQHAYVAPGAAIRVQSPGLSGAPGRERACGAAASASRWQPAGRLPEASPVQSKPSRLKSGSSTALICQTRPGGAGERGLVRTGWQVRMSPGWAGSLRRHHPAYHASLLHAAWPSVRWRARPRCPPRPPNLAPPGQWAAWCRHPCP